MQISTRKLLVPRFKHNIVYYTPAIGWGILIMYFSLLPAGNVPSILKNMWDFSLHAGIYFLLAALIFLGYARYKKKAFHLGLALLAALLAAVMGGAMELIQEHYIPNRHSEWLDFFANILGAIIASFCWKILTRNQ